METDFVEWNDDLAHFTFSLDFDTLLEIKNKGSLEDGHKDLFMQAILAAYNAD